MRMFRKGETLEEYAEEFWIGGEPNEVKMELPQDLKDYLDSVPLVTEEQANQLADHVRALDMKPDAKKRLIAQRHGITNENESPHNA